MAHDYFTDPRTWNMQVKNIGQELHALPRHVTEAEMSAVQKVNHANLKKVGVGDMRLLLNGLAMMARTQTNGHEYKDLFGQIAREYYYPALDAANAVIDSYAK